MSDCTGCIYDDTSKGAQLLDVKIGSKFDDLPEPIQRTILADQQVNRRAFSKNAARFGLGGALALILGLKSAEHAQAAWTCTCGGSILETFEYCSPISEGCRLRYRSRWKMGTQTECGSVCYWYTSCEGYHCRH